MDMGKLDSGRINRNPVQISTHLKDTRPEYNGRIWPWNRNLAVFSYMVPYDMPAEETTAAVEPKDEKPKEEAQESRVPAVVAVIALLGEGDFTKTGANPGAPKIDALTKLLGWKDNAVTTAERDEAWTLYQEKQDAGQPDTGNA